MLETNVVRKLSVSQLLCEAKQYLTLNNIGELKTWRVQPTTDVSQEIYMLQTSWYVRHTLPPLEQYGEMEFGGLYRLQMYHRKSTFYRYGSWATMWLGSCQFSQLLCEAKQYHTLSSIGEMEFGGSTDYNCITWSQHLYRFGLKNFVPLI